MAWLFSRILQILKSSAFSMTFVYSTFPRDAGSLQIPTLPIPSWPPRHDTPTCLPCPRIACSLSAAKTYQTSGLTMSTSSIYGNKSGSTVEITPDTVAHIGVLQCLRTSPSDTPRKRSVPGILPRNSAHRVPVSPKVTQPHPNTVQLPKILFIYLILLHRRMNFPVTCTCLVIIM